MKRREIFIDDYDYDLPLERVAIYPLPQRDESKLLCYENNELTVSLFQNLPDHLPFGSSLILNNTRVIEARILFQKPTGGIIELFCLEPAEYVGINEALSITDQTRWICYIGGASKWKDGEILTKEIESGESKFVLTARFVNKKEDAFTIEFSWDSPDLSFAKVLSTAGSVPLPPYIKRKPEAADSERYQTIFAANQGSVAAPTAALHFTEKVFDGLNEKNISSHYVTLHVGAGTFKPVKTDTIADHAMHAERFQVSLGTLTHLKNAKELVAVGTTSLRTMETLYWIGLKIIKGIQKPDEVLTLAQWECYELKNDKVTYGESISAIIDLLNNRNKKSVFCETSLLIVPGYKFQSAKALITNFHQPRSTLLLLVAAFVGDNWKNIYQYALENEFRFLSYGDSSLLWRHDIR